MSEKLPTGPLGPLTMKKLGKSGIEIERYAFGRGDHRSASVDAVAAGHGHRPHERVGVEPGGEHEHVELVEHAVDGADARRARPARSPTSTSSTFGGWIARVEVGRDDEPLAAGAVVGPQPLAQLRVLDRLEVLAAQLLDHRHALRVGVDHRGRERAERLGEVVVHRAQQLRIRRVPRALLLGVRVVGLGQHPLRGALEEAEVPGPARPARP